MRDVGVPVRESDSSAADMEQHDAICLKFYTDGIISAENAAQLRIIAKYGFDGEQQLKELLQVSTELSFIAENFFSVGRKVKLEDKKGLPKSARSMLSLPYQSGVFLDKQRNSSAHKLTDADGISHKTAFHIMMFWLDRRIRAVTEYAELCRRASNAKLQYSLVRRFALILHEGKDLIGNTVSVGQLDELRKDCCRDHYALVPYPRKEEERDSDLSVENEPNMSIRAKGRQRGSSKGPRNSDQVEVWVPPQDDRNVPSGSASSGAGDGGNRPRSPARRPAGRDKYANISPCEHCGSTEHATEFHHVYMDAQFAFPKHSGYQGPPGFWNISPKGKGKGIVPNRKGYPENRQWAEQWTARPSSPSPATDRSWYFTPKGEGKGKSADSGNRLRYAGGWKCPNCGDQLPREAYSCGTCEYGSIPGKGRGGGKQGGGKRPRQMWQEIDPQAERNVRPRGKGGQTWTRVPRQMSIWTCSGCGGENADLYQHCRGCGGPKPSTGMVEDSGFF